MNSNQATTKCKPGDRARIIKALNPENIGLIVCVVRPYRANEIICGTSWNPGGCPWVVVALTRSLAGVHEFGPSKGRVDSTRSGVLDDAALVPLDDDDDGLTIKTSKTKPKRIAKTAPKEIRAAVKQELSLQ